MLTNLAKYYFTLPIHLLECENPIDTKALCSMSLECIKHKVTRCQSCSHDMVQSSVVKGATLLTEHGAGVVVGFERFDSSGFSAPMADIQKGKERIIIELSAGHNWPCKGNYALYFHEIKKFN